MGGGGWSCEYGIGDKTFGSTYCDEGGGGKGLGIVSLTCEGLMSSREGSLREGAARAGVRK